MGLKVIMLVQNTDSFVILFLSIHFTINFGVGARKPAFSTPLICFDASQATQHGIILFVTTNNNNNLWRKNSGSQTTNKNRDREKESGKKFNYELKESNEGTTTSCLLHCTEPKF